MKKILTVFLCLFLMNGVFLVHAQENENEVITYEQLKGKKCRYTKDVVMLLQ